jgi:hypothetical protein
MLAGAFALGDAPMFPHRSLERASLFLLFLQEIISEGRSFTAGILGRRWRGERKNSEITACSGRTGLWLT